MILCIGVHKSVFYSYCAVYLSLLIWLYLNVHYFSGDKRIHVLLSESISKIDSYHLYHHVVECTSNWNRGDWYVIRKQVKTIRNICSNPSDESNTQSQQITIKVCAYCMGHTGYTTYMWLELWWSHVVICYFIREVKLVWRRVVYEV